MDIEKNELELTIYCLQDAKNSLMLNFTGEISKNELIRERITQIDTITTKLRQLMV